MRERTGVLREEVRKMIKSSDDVPEIVDLIITLQRLNLDYHYEDDINDKLLVVYNSNYDGGNLDLVSRRFYLLRKCGYHGESFVIIYLQILSYIYVTLEKTYITKCSLSQPTGYICMQMCF